MPLYFVWMVALPIRFLETIFLNLSLWMVHFSKVEAARASAFHAESIHILQMGGGARAPLLSVCRKRWQATHPQVVREHPIRNSQALFDGPTRSATADAPS